MKKQITYKTLFQLIEERIKKNIQYSKNSPYSNQTDKILSSPIGSTSDTSTAEILTAVQDLLSESLPPFIIDGLNVNATNPISDTITISTGKGSVGGSLYTVNSNISLRIPFDDNTEVFYIILYKNNVLIQRTYSSNKLTLAKIIVPNPGITNRVQDEKDNSDNAYIVMFKEYKLYGNGYGKFEEDTVELLRDNIGDILADNLIGNIRLSEDLKITNTQGTLELDSKSLKLKDIDENILAKFDRRGVYFYDTDGLELAKFSDIEARVGNIVIEPDSIHSANFVSGALGSGFKIDDLGNATLNSAFIRGKITSSTFVSESISAIGGNFLVMDSDVLLYDMTSEDNSTLTISGDTNFNVGDILRLKVGTEDEWIEVVSINGDTYTINRDKGNQYASNNNPEWKKGTCVVNYGQSNDGGIFMTASEDDSPYLDILTHSGSPWSSISTKVRLGNLNGIIDSLYGALSGYGLYSDNVFLKGKLYAPDIKTAISGARIELNSNGLLAYDDEDNNLFSMLLNTVSGIGDSGDLIIGNVDSENYIKWDNSSGLLVIRGDFGIVGGGKNVFKQSLTTSGEGIPTSENIGDIWINSDNDKMYRSAMVGATSIAEGEWELINTALSSGWASDDDITYINGGKIYTGSITADKIDVAQLDALTIDTGSLNVDETITVGSAGKVVIDGVNEVIKVYDASNNLRVELGKLP